MADPLSLTASIIAIVGVGGQVAKSIKKFASLKGAPDLILALNNELSDIRLIIIAIQDVLQRQRIASVSSPENQIGEANINASVISALNQANERVLKLEALHKKLVPFSSGLSGTTTGDKVTWLREQGKLKRIQEGLRDARLKLATALGVLNSSSLLRLETGIQTIHSKLRDLQNDQQNIRSELGQESIKQESSAEVLKRKMIDLSARQQQTETSQDQRLTRHEIAVQEPLTRLLAAQQRLELKLDLAQATSIARAVQSNTSAAMQPISSDRTYVAQSLYISASTSRTKCSYGCSCICHQRQTRKTPAFLSRYFGTLFIGYTGLPKIVQPCDIHDCIQRTGSMAVVTYFFPLWLLARALFLTIKLSSCDGPHFCLRVPRVVHNSSAIIDFAARGNINGVKQILQERLGSPFDCESNTGSSPLGWAVYNLRLEMCEFLLKMGADPYHEDNLHRNSFDHVWYILLTKKCDASTTDRLRTLFPSEDYLDKYGFTLLHKTVLGLNNLDLTTLLASLPNSIIKKGDDLDRTAAWWAAARGDCSSLSLLIEHGADIDKASHRGSRPLDIAIEFNRLACADLLIDAGHNIEYSGVDGATPLHQCCHLGGDITLMERLMRKGAKIDACDINGNTPLHWASQSPNEQLAKCLILHGANLNILNSFGESPLYSMIQYNSLRALQTLLQHHADCSLRTKAGETPLHYAAQFSNSQCLAVLRSFDLSRINVHDRITGISPGQTLKGIVRFTALEVAKRRTDTTPEWLGIFQKLIHEIEFPEARLSADLTETEDFQDALERQD